MFVNGNKVFFSVFEVTSQETILEEKVVNPEKYNYNLSVRW
jgi:hypothetical protein